MYPLARTWSGNSVEVELLGNRAGVRLPRHQTRFNGLYERASIGCPQPSGLNTRTVEAGLAASFESGRMGRDTRLPPQLGQHPPSLLSTQSRQKVHSKVQIIASVADGGKSLLQHSQFGRSSSILAPHGPQFQMRTLRPVYAVIPLLGVR